MEQQNPGDRALSITLTANEWNSTLDAMSLGPYRQVAPLIAKIHDQAQAQQQPAPPKLAAE